MNSGQTQNSSGVMNQCTDKSQSHSSERNHIEDRKVGGGGKATGTITEQRRERNSKRILM